MMVYCLIVLPKTSNPSVCMPIPLTSSYVRDAYKPYICCATGTTDTKMYSLLMVVSCSENGIGG